MIPDLRRANVEPRSADPQTLGQVARQKDIQYASRARSHVARQKQIHHLRHVIRELAKHIPKEERSSSEVKELVSWGCGTTMHVVTLAAPRLDGEDQFKDIDFTPEGIRARRQAGLKKRRILALAPWQHPVDPTQGVVIHDTAQTAMESELAGVDGFAGRTK